MTLLETAITPQCFEAPAPEDIFEFNDDTTFVST